MHAKSAHCSCQTTSQQQILGGLLGVHTPYKHDWQFPNMQDYNILKALFSLSSQDAMPGDCAPYPRDASCQIETVTTTCPWFLFMFFLISFLPQLSPPWGCKVADIILFSYVLSSQQSCELGSG